MKTKTQITVYANDQIYRNENGTYEWVSNSTESMKFSDTSELLNYADEETPEVYEQIMEWVEEYDL